MKLSLNDPLLATYAVAAIMILKAVSMSWLTVVRMIQEKGGFRAPEDIGRASMNPDPSAIQLELNDRVERIRSARILRRSVTTCASSCGRRDR